MFFSLDDLSSWKSLSNLSIETKAKVFRIISNNTVFKHGIGLKDDYLINSITKNEIKKDNFNIY